MWFLVFWSSFWVEETITLNSLFFELVKVISTESRRSIAITYLYWGLIWGCLWWSVRSQMWDWTSIPLLHARICSAFHSALQFGSLFLGLLHVQSWLPVETLLLTSCLARSQRPILWYISCVLLLDNLIWCCGKAWAAAISPVLISQIERGTFPCWSKHWWCARDISHVLQHHTCVICRWVAF